MNKEKLLELSDTLRSIAEGANVASFEQWLEDGWINCKFRYKHEPQTNPYAALKAAHAAGKLLQHKYPGEEEWHDCSTADKSQQAYAFIWPPENYRIKPEQQKLPLCADDVKAGAQFLSKCGQVWFPNHIREGYVCFGHFMSLTFQELIDDEWKIRCAGETDWHPCYKLVEQ